jgi:hypothetical protein
MLSKLASDNTGRECQVNLQMFDPPNGRQPDFLFPRRVGGLEGEGKGLHYLGVCVIRKQSIFLRRTWARECM